MKFLTSKQAAQQLNLTIRRVQALCSKGRLGQKIGGRYLITQTDLNHFKQLPRSAGRPRKDNDATDTNVPGR